jgi:hypothetical protein
MDLRKRDTTYIESGSPVPTQPVPDWLLPVCQCAAFLNSYIDFLSKTLRDRA